MVIWLDPDVVQCMDSWLHTDNCKNRSEMIGKAIRFYMGYLATADVSEYLSKALVATLLPYPRTLAAKPSAAGSPRIRRRGGMDGLSASAGSEGYGACADAGQISFDKSLDTQRRLRGDEWMD